MRERAMGASEQLRVAVDGTSLLGVRTGVGHVAAGMVRALDERTELALSVFAVTWRGRHDLAAALPPGVEARTARIPAQLVRALWLRGASFPRAERWTGTVDVVHAPNFVAPPARAPVVVTIHDLTFVHFPEYSPPDVQRFPKLVRHALDRGATVHVDSDFVGAEVRDVFGLEPDRVVRVYPGLVSMAGGDAGAGRTLAGTDRYVLALGTIEPRKNLPALVRAFDALAAEQRDVSLVVAGPDGWDQGAFAAACATARHGDRVRRLGYVEATERRDLLAGAAAFAYPSIYEGFGIPPLEAMTAGVPVVASRAGSLPEVIGDAAQLVDPADEEAIAHELGRVLDDGDLRASLIARGHARVTAFSWSTMAAELSDLYHRLHAGVSGGVR